MSAALEWSAYTDPSLQALEREGIFARAWQYVGHFAELGQGAGYVAGRVGDIPVVVTRDRTGLLRAFLNVCRHRGSVLAAGAAARETLQCPYHAWTYGLDGKLIAAPNLTGMPDVDRTEFGLTRLHLREWLGYAWVCLADEPPSFEDTVVSAVTERLGGSSEIESYDIGSLSVGKRIEYDVKANWKQIIENFMECYHCATIHPELTEVLPEFADGYAAQYYVGHGAEFGADVSGFTVDGSEGVDRLPGVTEAQDRRYYAITIRPQVFVNLVPDHVIWHRMFPLAPDRTLVRCDWLYLPSVVESGKDLSRSVELFHRVNLQDFEACERCQLAMGSRSYANGGVLVPSEHHIGEFHDWVRGRVS